MGTVLTIPKIVREQGVEIILDPKTDFRDIIKDVLGIDAEGIYEEILQQLEEAVEENKKLREENEILQSQIDDLRDELERYEV